MPHPHYPGGIVTDCPRGSLREVLREVIRDVNHLRRDEVRPAFDDIEVLMGIHAEVGPPIFDHE